MSLGAAAMVAQMIAATRATLTLKGMVTMMETILSATAAAIPAAASTLPLLLVLTTMTHTINFSLISACSEESCSLPTTMDPWR